VCVFSKGKGATAPFRILGTDTLGLKQETEKNYLTKPARIKWGETDD